MEGKKPRINNIDLVDRISALPDFILGQILSFLPTNEAVATSILSKRWKFAWVTAHNLDFCSRIAENEEETMEFVRFVNRVLLLNDVGSLNKFRLTCYIVSVSSQIISWIDTAITRNVHDLFLVVPPDINMPTSVFSCDSLRSLDLHGFNISVPDTAFCLPRLESIVINRVKFESQETCEKLVNGCPVLHYLDLTMEDSRGDADNDVTCIISSASLRHLEIFFGNTGKLKLKASSLEYLRLRGSISEIFVEKSLSSLVEVDFQIHLDEHDFPDNSIVEAVRAFDCTKSLELSANVMRALSRAIISLSTEFKRSINLEVKTYCRPLQDFIQNSESLEEIFCQALPMYPHPHDHPRWTTPLEVPRCLSTSLKYVYFYGYKGSEDERDMICYILKYGSVLKVVRVSSYTSKGDGETLKWLKEICEFPRKSPFCKVQFS